MYGSLLADVGGGGGSAAGVAIVVSTGSAVAAGVVAAVFVYAVVVVDAIDFIVVGVLCPQLFPSHLLYTSDR